MDKEIECLLEPARMTPIAGHYDVIVVGGGCAGITAATAAARNGARTLLVERFGFLGGTATASLMANINAFRNQKKPDRWQTTRGIGEELILNLILMNGAVPSRAYEQSEEYDGTPGKLAYSYTVDTEAFKFAALKMVVESGADLLFHTYFSSPVMQNDAVSGIIVENKAGRQAYLASIVVDASGDADVAARAGAPFWQIRHDEGSRLGDQLMYKVSGIDTSLGIAAGGCSIGTSSVYWGPYAGNIDGLDPKELSRAEVETRLKIFEHFNEQKEKNPALKNSVLTETGPLLGIRQTRFIEGEYKLTGEDAISGASFEDSIAACSSPIIHYYGYRRYLEHEGYEIPYRCLVPLKVNGLLVAGRCISSDQPAYESYRAMAPIMAIGQAAGTAAAMAAELKAVPRKLDYKPLRERLISQGQEVGQGRPK